MLARMLQFFSALLIILDFRILIILIVQNFRSVKIFCLKNKSSNLLYCNYFYHIEVWVNMQIIIKNSFVTGDVRKCSTLQILREKQVQGWTDFVCSLHRHDYFGWLMSQHLSLRYYKLFVIHDKQTFRW